MKHIVSSCILIGALLLPQSLNATLYHSTGITDYDIIQESDPSMYLCMEYLGEKNQEMPDDRNEGQLTISGVYTFRGYYSDGAEIEFHINPEFGSETAARKEAERYADRLGKIPSMMRKDVKRLVAHGSGKSGFSSDKGLIITYSDYTDKKLAHNHLEESLFHESVHASFDDEHRFKPEWVKAQSDDGQFLTEYGKSKPDREDLAESALFAYSILHFPGRIPAANEDKIKQAIPNRIEYIKNILPKNKDEIFAPAISSYTCDGTKSKVSVFEQSGNFPTAQSSSKDTSEAESTGGVDYSSLHDTLVLDFGKDSDAVQKYLDSQAATSILGTPENIASIAKEFSIPLADFKAKLFPSENISPLRKQLHDKLTSLNLSQEKLTLLLEKIKSYKENIDTKGFSADKKQRYIVVLDTLVSIIMEDLLQ